MKKSDCCLIQIACGDQARLIELTMRRHAEYCAAHDIDYRLIIGATTTQACFMEMWFDAIAQALKEAYKSVVFLDSDAAIVGDTDLREACTHGRFSATWHDNPNWNDDRLFDHFNLGCFYIGNSSEVRQRLREWRQLWMSGDSEVHPWGHQHTFNKRFAAHCDRLGHEWNSTPYYPSDGPIVMAWHGYGSISDRYEIMKATIGEPDFTNRTVTVGSAEETVAKAMLYESTGKIDEALALYRFCLRFDPENAAVLKRVGCLLNAKKEWAEAIEVFEKAVEITPDDGELWMILGGTCQYLGDIDRALVAANRSIEMIAGNPAAHVNRGMALLRAGLWAEGFTELEWQYVCANRNIRHPSPAWDGSPVETLYVYAEQGYGDTLMLFRLLSHNFLGDRVQKVVLEVPTALVSFLKPQISYVEVIERQPDGRISCDFDAHIGMMSLPRVLGLTPERARDADRWQVQPGQPEADEWARRLTGNGFRVGICWAGNESHANDRNRTISAAMFDELVRTAGCAFVSLQKDAGITDEIRESTPEVQFVGDDLADFADTAAVIANLDLVITVDTAVAHLAGAMGKPVWILLSKASDWRWLSDRDDSVWYSSARLFRQEVLGDWSPVLASVQTELEKMKDGRRDND